MSKLLEAARTRKFKSQCSRRVGLLPVCAGGWVALDLTAVAGMATGIGGLVVASVVAYQSHRQGWVFEGMLRSFQRVAESYEAEVRGLREEVAALRAASGRSRDADAAKLALEQAKEARREREAAWRRTKDLAKGIGWLMDATDEGA